jgi:dipeptidyl aminopeptidase/acylaminoacyl peptidase
MLEKPLFDKNSPWKQRYYASTVFTSQIASSAPTKGILATNKTGTIQWYFWNVLTNDLKQITNTPNGHSSLLAISPDSNWVYYLHDAQGNEIGHYVRMSSEGGILEDISPLLPPFSSFGFAISRAGNRIGFIAAFGNLFHLYCIDVNEDGGLSNLRELYGSPNLLVGVMLSYGGEVLTVMSTERSRKLQFSLQAFDTQTGNKLAELWDGEQNSLEMMVSSPVPGDPRLLATTTKTGIETLVVWNPHLDTYQDLKLENIIGAVRALDWSPDGNQILFRTLNSAIQKLYLHNLVTGETVPLQTPAGTNFSPYFTPKGYEIYSHWQSSTQPSQIISISTITNEVVRTVISAGIVPPGHEWKSVSFLSSDGQAIQGWLGTPHCEGPFPTILETHGGPTAVQCNAFLPSAQAWIDHGFAYLTINYRGSTTFGREFEHKIFGQPGNWEIEDLVAARNWLVQQGISQSDSILLTGWSYGGFLTLLGLGKTPELWAGGMAGVAITDWVLSYEDSAETLRGFQTAFFGGTPQEKPEQYRDSSPISYVNNVKVPVLIIQGRYDTRTPARPVEVYESKMKDLNKDIEVYWYNTGHTGSRDSVEEGIRHQELMLRFAYRVLSNRFTRNIS